MLYNSTDTYSSSNKSSQKPLKRLSSSPHHRHQPPSPNLATPQIPNELYGALLHYHLQQQQQQQLINSQEFFMNHHNNNNSHSFASLQLMQRQMALATAAQQFVSNKTDTSPTQLKHGLNSPALSTGSSSHSGSTTDSTNSLNNHNNNNNNRQYNIGQSGEDLLSQKRPYLKFSMDSILGTSDEPVSKKLRVTETISSTKDQQKMPAKDVERIQLNYNFLSQVVANQRNSGGQNLESEGILHQQQLAMAAAVSGNKVNQQQAQFNQMGMGKI